MSIVLGSIPLWMFADATGRWNAGGKLSFYRSVAKDQRKTVYQDAAGLIPYPNPITLDSVGAVSFIYFNDDEPYYIVARNPQDTDPSIREFDNYVPAGGGGGATSTEIDYTNFVMNGQFRFFDQNPFTSISASEIEIAPYWYFNKSNTSATDTIEFLPFLVGVTNPPFSPTYFVRYLCTNVPSGETYKDFYIKIKDVNAFQNQFITMSIEQQGSSPVQLIEFRYIQHFGTGGSPSADVSGAIAAHNVNATWDKTSSTFILPTIAGKTLGTNKDDYLALIIRLPLDVITQFDFTNFQVNLGDKILDYEYQTYDKAKIEYRSINYPIYRDIRGLFTEQNITDITKLITIKEGFCSDHDNNDIFKLKQSLTKDISLPWAEGDLNGGLPSSLTLTADTFYHVFAIFRPNGGIDGGFDTDINASNLLADSNVQAAGYLFYRRIWTIKTETSTTNIENYTQTYDYHIINTVDNYVEQVLTSPYEWTPTIHVPPDISVKALLNFAIHASGGFSDPDAIGMIFNNGANFQNPSYLTYPLATQMNIGIGKNIVHGNLYVITNIDQTIRIKLNITGGDPPLVIRPAVSVLGWQDWRID